MKTTVKILSVLLLVFSECFSQIEPGARQVALAHSDISCPVDVFSLFNNPSGLSFIKTREVGFYYSPSPYGVKELSNAYAAYCEPTAFGSLSAGFSVYGFELYKETKFAIGYSRKIVPSLFIGITSLYQNISIKNYGSKGILKFNFGAITCISEKVNLGFYVENITRSSLSGESNDLPTILWLGSNLSLFKELIFSCALKKELGYNPSIRLGTEYSLNDFLILRFGASNEPSTYSGGFGIIYGIVHFDYAISSHSDLGLSHQIGLILSFNK